MPLYSGEVGVLCCRKRKKIKTKQEWERRQNVTDIHEQRYNTNKLKQGSIYLAFEF